MCKCASQEAVVLIGLGQRKTHFLYKVLSRTDFRDPTQRQLQIRFNPCPFKSRLIHALCLMLMGMVNLIHSPHGPLLPMAASANLPQWVLIMTGCGLSVTESNSLLDHHHQYSGWPYTRLIVHHNVDSHESSLPLYPARPQSH